MKRFATIAAIVTTVGVAVPSVAAAGNGAQIKPQITAQIVGAQAAQVQRVKVAVTAQRIASQRADAKRFSILLRAQVR